MKNRAGFKDKYEIDSEQGLLDCSLKHRDSPLKRDSPIKGSLIEDDDDQPITIEFKQLKNDYVAKPPSPVRVNTDEEIIAFPTRNPLYNIKDYKK